MKGGVNAQLALLKSTAMVLGLCDKGTLAFETLQEPHKTKV